VADETKKVGSVVYREAGSEYFEKRGLRRHAGVWSLWALGVAAVISGDFSGWNLGIPAGGWGGLVVATVVITIMYIGLCYSIAEMSPAMPHTGGAYSFGRSAMGPWGGFITGLAENMEYVVTPAVVVFFAGSYAQPVFDELIGVNIPQPWWWLIFYMIFVGLNIIGIEATMRFSVVICLMSLAVLAIFFIGAIPKFDSKLLSDVGDGSFLPFGIEGVFKNLPYAIWFYLAIEELPLAAEESMDPKRDVPRGTLLGLLTLVALAGLVASFHTIIFAYGRNIFSLSRAGYFPHWMSVTHGERKTPYVALVLGGVVGWVLAFVMYQASKEGGSTVGAALLNMAVFGAVISYFMQCLSFVMLRRKMPNIARPYRSPIGEWGAVIAGIIALGALISLYLDEAYRPGVYGVAIWFVLGIVYFAIIGRNRLVLSPEEEFALTQGERGHPEDEGYGKTHVADVQT